MVRRPGAPRPPVIPPSTLPDGYRTGFGEEPGYLDYARIGPLSAAAHAESLLHTELLTRARFGSLDHLRTQAARAQQSVARIIGFRPDQVVSQPGTTSGLMQAVFGLTGELLLSPAGAPSLPVAAVRAEDSLHVVTPRWLTTDHGRVTPGQIREQISPSTVAVAVCLVDPRTGFRVDLDGIRQVIGDRLLIVDAAQGFGVVDAAYEVADVVASGGRTWARAGDGTGFLALSDRALNRLVPVFSGFGGSEDDPWDVVTPPRTGAGAFCVRNSDALADARFAAALEEIDGVGVAGIENAVTDNVTQVIDLADEYAVPVASSRDERQRAGIIVLQPPHEQLTVLRAALSNHGVTCSTLGRTVRLSVHAQLAADTVDMLRGAFTSYATAARY
ncbi:MAG: aminotransferase class V-fold PLP-dependent enzyme [Cryobacterium sp.]